MPTRSLYASTKERSISISTLPGERWEWTATYAMVDWRTITRSRQKADAREESGGDRTDRLLASGCGRFAAMAAGRTGPASWRAERVKRGIVTER